ncbi:hypothetical protein GCM10022409_33410 [Hymenobacter glaciei]|uniref:DUF1440 domain-containing protein n=1 Tax=Hymenobacter glaciei TaxID=877209 RepID=A0ABP7UJ71_9BACT
METPQVPGPEGHPVGWGRAAFVTGLLAGTLDITAACTQYVLTTHKSPVDVLDFIASALFGKEAFAGGVGMALTGLVAHYLIAIMFAVFFYWLSPRLTWLLEHPVLAGVFYGMAVWLLMNLVVLPNSRVGVRPLEPVPSAIGLGILILCIGLPIAVRATRYYNRRRLAL